MNHIDIIDFYQDYGGIEMLIDLQDKAVANDLESLESKISQLAFIKINGIDQYYKFDNGNI